MLGKLLRNSAFRIGLLLLVTQVSTTVAAEGLESTGLRLVSERPNPSGEATLITVGILIFDIDEVDDVSQRFSVDMFTTLAWHDPRLALSEDQRFGRSRSLPLDEIWTPQGLIVNDRGLSAQLPRSANIDDLGNVVYRQRLSGQLAVALELSEFPFDTQRLPIDFVSYEHSPDEVRFSVNTDIRGDAGSFSAAGWRMKIIEPEYSEFTVPAIGVVRPRLTYYYRLYVVDGVLATAGNCPGTYRHLDRLYFFVVGFGFQHSPEPARGFLHDSRRPIRDRLYAIDLCGARCGRHRQSLGKLGSNGKGVAA
jgi:hypothetical protein